MIQVEWYDRDGRRQLTLVDAVKVWEARGGGREHPDGSVIEGWRDGSGVLQLDADDRTGAVYFKEV